MATGLDPIVIHPPAILGRVKLPFPGNCSVGRGAYLQGLEGTDTDICLAADTLVKSWNTMSIKKLKAKTLESNAVMYPPQ